MSAICLEGGDSDLSALILIRTPFPCAGSDPEQQVILADMLGSSYGRHLSMPEAAAVPTSCIADGPASLLSWLKDPCRRTKAAAFRVLLCRSCRVLTEALRACCMCELPRYDPGLPVPPA